MAKLFFKYGQMNCGKTLEIIKTIYNYQEKNKETLLIKPKIDTKGGDHIVSRNNASIKVDHLVSKDDNIYDIVQNYQKQIPIYIAFLLMKPSY